MCSKGLGENKPNSWYSPLGVRRFTFLGSLLVWDLHTVGVLSPLIYASAQSDADGSGCAFIKTEGRLG